MNALGKVLTIFVFLGSLVWLGFTAALFATQPREFRDDARQRIGQSQPNEPRTHHSADQVLGRQFRNHR